jgi:NAD(P)-dependent dehydrogenase (short-subunit alcohol dehydrogenase family)
VTSSPQNVTSLAASVAIKGINVACGHSLPKRCHFAADIEPDVTAKHGIMGMTKVAASENGHRGIRCNRCAGFCIRSSRAQTHLLAASRPASFTCASLLLSTSAAPHDYEQTPFFASLGRRINKSEEEIVDSLSTVVPMGRVGQAQEVARTVAFLLSDEASYISGANLPIDGAYLTTGA